MLKHIHWISLFVLLIYFSRIGLPFFPFEDWLQATKAFLSEDYFFQYEFPNYLIRISLVLIPVYYWFNHQEGDILLDTIRIFLLSLLFFQLILHLIGFYQIRPFFFIEGGINIFLLICLLLDVVLNKFKTSN